MKISSAHRDTCTGTSVSNGAEARVPPVSLSDEHFSLGVRMTAAPDLSLRAPY